MLCLVSLLSDGSYRKVIWRKEKKMNPLTHTFAAIEVNKETTTPRHWMKRVKKKKRIHTHTWWLPPCITPGWWIDGHEWTCASDNEIMKRQKAGAPVWIKFRHLASAYVCTAPSVCTTMIILLFMIIRHRIVMWRLALKFCFVRFIVFSLVCRLLLLSIFFGRFNCTDTHTRAHARHSTKHYESNVSLSSRWLLWKNVKDSFYCHFVWLALYLLCIHSSATHSPYDSP